MARYYAFHRFLFVLFILCTNPDVENKKKELCGFLYGIVLPDPKSIYPHTKDNNIDKLIADLKELGINAVRVNTAANSPSGFLRRYDNKYTVSEVSEKVIQDYSNLADFSHYNLFLKKLKENFGDNIITIGIASIGYTTALPCYRTDDCPFKLEPNLEEKSERLPKRYLPDVVGKEYFLGWAYLNTRALVRNLKGLVDIWQVENEVNVTCETVIFGWRHGASWCSREFVRNLVKTIYQAIKDEDEKALTTINLHTDFLSHIDVAQKGEWIKGGIEVDLEDFWDSMDIVGFDFYPNYIAVVSGSENASNPDKAKSVSVTINAIKDFIDKKIKKPVVIIETGYPSAPEELGFSETKQAEYLSNIFKNSQDAINGVIYYTFSTSETFDPERPKYQQVESYFGLIRADGTRKIAFETYKNLQKDNKKTWCK